MKLLFLGSPGVGKGTYAQVFEKELGIPHISTGDLLRAEAKNNKELEAIMKKGELVSDETMIKLIEKRIKQPDCEKGFILDGFPRNLMQANHLKNLIEITHVLNFKANDEVIIERLSGRITCKKCNKIFHKTGNIPKKEGQCDECGGELYQREDDKPESVKKRLDVYKEKTKPLIDHYTNEGLLVEIIINKPISEIRDKLVEEIKNFLEGKISKVEEIK
jgi:adenylate kinase